MRADPAELLYVAAVYSKRRAILDRFRRFRFSQLMAKTDCRSGRFGDCSRIIGGNPAEGAMALRRLVGGRCSEVKLATVSNLVGRNVRASASRSLQFRRPRVRRNCVAAG